MRCHVSRYELSRDPGTGLLAVTVRDVINLTSQHFSGSHVTSGRRYSELSWSSSSVIFLLYIRGREKSRDHGSSHSSRACAVQYQFTSGPSVGRSVFCTSSMNIKHLAKIGRALLLLLLHTHLFVEINVFYDKPGNFGRQKQQTDHNILLYVYSIII